MLSCQVMCFLFVISMSEMKLGLYSLLTSCTSKKKKKKKGEKKTINGTFLDPSLTSCEVIHRSADEGRGDWSADDSMGGICEINRWWTVPNTFVDDREEWESIKGTHKTVPTGREEVLPAYNLLPSCLLPLSSVEGTRLICMLKNSAGATAVLLTFWFVRFRGN